MKKYLTLISMLLILPLVFAQSEQIGICHIPPGEPAKLQTIQTSIDSLSAHLNHGDFEGTCDQNRLTDAPGVTPDSMLWPGDVGLDRLRILFTIDPYERAQKRIGIVQERLSEMEKMMEKEKFESLVRAQGAYLASIEELSSDLDSLENVSTSSLDSDIELEAKIEEHRASLAILRSNWYDPISKEGKKNFDKMLEKTEEIYEKKLDSSNKLKGDILSASNISESHLFSNITKAKSDIRNQLVIIGFNPKDKTDAQEKLEEKLKEELEKEIKESVIEQINQIGDSS